MKGLPNKTEGLQKLKEIQEYFESSRYQDFQDSKQMIYIELITLNGWLSFAGKMATEYRKQLNIAKDQAYINLIGSQRASSIAIPPSIAKDHAHARCGEAQYRFEFADRVAGNCQYRTNTLIAILSTLK